MLALTAPELELLGETLQKALPIIDGDGSDTAMFDNCLEFLTLTGRSLPHAVMMMIPEPWEKHQHMTPTKKAFYEYVQEIHRVEAAPRVVIGEGGDPRIACDLLDLPRLRLAAVASEAGDALFTRLPHGDGVRRLAAGEPVSRNITVGVLGQLETQIPALEPPATPGINVYPDKPELTRTVEPGGIRGMRSDQYAMIGVAPGPVVLPALEVPWWNTRTAEWEVARLPERTITVLPSGEAPPPPPAPETGAETAAEVEAFHVVQRLRIQQQLATSDLERVNRIDPRDLNELHRLMLKEAFKQAKKIQLRLKQQFDL